MSEPTHEFHKIQTAQWRSKAKATSRFRNVRRSSKVRMGYLATGAFDSISLSDGTRPAGALAR